MPEPVQPGLIDEAQVRHIARLARLNLRPEEVQSFTAQLAGILHYVRQLADAPTEGVAPLAHPLTLTNVVAEDVPHDSLPTEAALANAPARADAFFKVPAVLDQGGA